MVPGKTEDQLFKKLVEPFKRYLFETVLILHPERFRHLTQEMVLAPIESDQRSASRLRVQPSTIIWQGEVFKK